MITDKLASYGTAKKEVIPSVQHRQARAFEVWSGISVAAARA